jgi:amidase
MLPVRSAHTRRIVLTIGLLAGVGVVAAQSQRAATFDLGEMTISDLQRQMESGQETSRSLVDKYLARIDAIDRNGPALRSILEINPDAAATADALDAERRAGRVRGPLHGVPVLIKDNIATHDRMMTTAGSLALAGAPAPKDAFVVQRLRDAGAVILGKTNLSEWANFRSTHSSSGWSGRGGQTRNPYAPDRNPSGSSSGSAVAVAANLAAAAVGTETVNSLVGIKPTLGLISRTGIVPIAHSQDTAGPMARTVADAALLLGVLAGSDPADTATLRADAQGRRNYLSSLVPMGLRGARIGVVRNRLFGYSPATDALADAAIVDLKREGAIIVDPAPIPTLGKFDDGELEVLLYEYKADLNAYLTSLGATATVHSLKDVIAFNQAHNDDELRYFGQEIMINAESKGPLTSAKYRAELARNHLLSRTQGIDATMTAYKLDALIAPTGGPAWIIDLVNGDGGTAAAPGPSTVTSVAGYPHITVPMGFVRGLPVGLSFFGRAWSEPTLIKFAYAYEQATKHRRPPTFALSATP